MSGVDGEGNACSLIQSIYHEVGSAFMTSSKTSSNILFAPLHQSVVGTMEVLSFDVVLAGHFVGSVIGNAIALSNIVIGASTAELPDEDQLQIMPPELIYTLIAGGLTSVVAVVLHFITAA